MYFLSGDVTPSVNIQELPQNVTADFNKLAKCQ